MKAFTVLPLVCVGNVKFGDPRQQVRQRLGEYKEFKKNKYSKNTTDDFGFCHVFYDENNTCEAIEFFDGVELLLNDSAITGISSDEFAKLISSSVNGDSCINKKMQIGAYISGDNVESIMVARKGYFK